MIAVAHTILISVWHMLTNNVDYQDLGSDWLDRYTDPGHETRRLLRRLEALGHRVTLEPAA